MILDMKACEGDKSNFLQAYHKLRKTFLNFIDDSMI